MKNRAQFVARQSVATRRLVHGAAIAGMIFFAADGALRAKETAAKSSGEAIAKDAEAKNKEKENEALRRPTAVTLNYCRASFYRIQKRPTYQVLIEEQEKILNNLDLNGIVDQDVIKLYTAVLIEISEVRLADRERHMIQDRYQTSLGTVLTGDAFDFGTELASQHYLAAVRTGARSWWDYRNVTVGRDSDVFHVDQKRLMAFTEKSAQFLDTFWKLARDRKIPDRWLVRNQDLNRLDAAMLEPDLRVRLRVLKRMQDFMTCYPPYWYYVARTQQAMGYFPAAACTYDKLLQMAPGHFRKDDMLAAALANEAMIQDYLHQPSAMDSALKALGYSTDVWEANLMCAQVLARNGHLPEAEDAVLRNLDVGLERTQSAVALVSLYTRRASLAKLQARLSDPAIVRRMPLPSLIRAAAVLGPGRLPEAVMAHWTSSVAAGYDLKFGPDEFVLDTTPLWNLQASEMSLVVGNESFRKSTIAMTSGRSEVRFAGIGEVGHPLYASGKPPSVQLIIKYPGAPLVRLKFDPRADASAGWTTSARLPVVDLLASGSFSSRRQNLSLVSLEIGDAMFPVSLRPNSGIIVDNLETEAAPLPSSAEPNPPAANKPSAAAGLASTQLVPTTVKTEPPPQRTAPEPPIPVLSMPRYSTPQQPADGPRLLP